MNNPQTILNATQLIVASPAPVVFLDTCAVLDIIRTPQREEIQNKIVSVSSDFILKATANPKQIWIKPCCRVDSDEMIAAPTRQ